MCIRDRYKIGSAINIRDGLSIYYKVPPPESTLLKIISIPSILAVVSITIASAALMYYLDNKSLSLSFQIYEFTAIWFNGPEFIPSSPSAKFYKWSFLLAINIIFSNTLKTFFYMGLRDLKFPAWGTLADIRGEKLMIPDAPSFQDFARKYNTRIVPFRPDKDPFQVIEDFKKADDVNFLLYGVSFMEYITAFDCDLVAPKGFGKLIELNFPNFYNLRIPDELIRQIDMSILNVSIYLDEIQEINKFSATLRLKCSTCLLYTSPSPRDS
eukprot:TRINITY_DN17405_c0_g1_i2.p1 TRINITY_DN17405_c0_g1~~TRINITY_DN17405_c0_g1_i2.p1  ORF type:complete len:269 (-),score=37.28 TRINITY_DN17405_c0_g1_i2:37-843(-)